MPRLTLGPFFASLATAGEYVPAFRTTKPIRMRRVYVIVTELITGGTTGVTMRVGYAPSGTEIVASVAMTATALDSEQALTIATPVVPANKWVMFKATATDRGAGRYCVGFEWDDDY